MLQGPSLQFDDKACDNYALFFNALRNSRQHSIVHVSRTLIQVKEFDFNVEEANTSKVSLIIAQTPLMVLAPIVGPISMALHFSTGDEYIFRVTEDAPRMQPRLQASGTWQRFVQASLETSLSVLKFRTAQHASGAV